MIKEEFYFDSRDGESRLHAVRYRPEGEARGVLQVVHGMAEYAERYEELAVFLAERGIVVTGEDHLGHGKSVGEAGRTGYFCEQDPATVLVRDVHRLKKLTEVLYPDLPYVILGHSMGSFIARNYLCRYGTGISGAVIMGTGMQPMALLRMAKAAVGMQRLFFGSRHVSRLLDRLAFGGYGRRVDSPRTPWDWLSRDGERVDRYIADPMCGFTFTVNGFGALFELVARLYNEEALSAVPKELPVFLMSGDADPVGDYGKGVARTYESLLEAGLVNVKMNLYEGGRHELLNETCRGQVMEDVWRWLEDTVLRATALRYPAGRG